MRLRLGHQCWPGPQSTLVRPLRNYQEPNRFRFKDLFAVNALDIRRETLLCYCRCSIHRLAKK
eukprot:TCALIF_05767-PA protein Name:"Protein of unknown function" AED:0.41 eAED:0.41 QI:0/0.5/0.33/1/0/0/3/24/62